MLVREWLASLSRSTMRAREAGSRLASIPGYIGPESRLDLG